jgi:hypothetical protein
MPTLLSDPAASQTATINTEHVLITDTTNKNYVLVVDTAAMVALDVTELRIYTKCLAGGTSRVAYYAVYAQPQAHPIKYSVPVPANIEIKCTLKQTEGTGRAYPWALLSVT